jgi:hypothetical protein
VPQPGVADEEQHDDQVDRHVDEADLLGVARRQREQVDEAEERGEERAGDAADHRVVRHRRPRIDVPVARQTISNTNDRIRPPIAIGRASGGSDARQCLLGCAWVLLAT